MFGHSMSLNMKKHWGGIVTYSYSKRFDYLTSYGAESGQYAGMGIVPKNVVTQGIEKICSYIEQTAQAGVEQQQSELMEKIRKKESQIKPNTEITEKSWFRW
jgi:hypothetical protein